ncbi:MAG TPA: DUF5685 family protein [Actinophytocola sp.]|uniref:DUF5685 family protein n=1 Tax=Actinophytocola sp. TaxID=1872138 RepID=UPI002DB7DC68|nr:DUF5685 family protein [Actinophytocola sp.]HEU5472355.1 DUF5685 family protein [Actinophytocola sp.]
MFGIIRPCRHRLSPALHTAWGAHLCGLCLALRDEYGQFARLVTNYDGLVVSALVEAQATTGDGTRRRTAGPCPLRAMRTAAVATGSGARLAAAASLLLASAKLADHVTDGDGPRVLATASAGLAGRWAEQGTRTGRRLGFDTGVLLDALRRQPELEAATGPGDSLLAVTEPTETATAEICGHTAVLAGRPENVAPLREAGRLFGRIAHLLDAVEDRAEDAERGVWNPLTATGTDLAEARRLCTDALLGIRLALREAMFTDDALVHALLVHELEHSVTRIFGHAEQPPPKPLRPGRGLWRWPRLADPPHRRSVAAGCAAIPWMCCTCQICCRDPFPGPWSGKPREAVGCDCDCSPC